MSDSRPTVPTRLLLAALAVLTCAPGALAQDDDLPPNHPSNDPYTQGDPARMAAAGIVSLGGFEFGRTDTAEIDAYLPNSDIRWIETEHFELGFGLAATKPSREERELLEPELTRLRAALPEVPEKPRRLDPWLRAHLYAQRLESLYDRMQTILQVSDADFPPRPVATYDLRKKYMGMGPYLGQRGKYEVLILPGEGVGLDFMQRHYGLSVKQSQRWNVIDRGAITLTVVADDYTRKNDLALFGHVAFNLAINLLDGYKMYTYEIPIWLREGFAHLLEREISPEHNTFDADEGSSGAESRETDWLGEVRELARAGEAPSLSKLSRLRSYGEMTLADHFSSWSKVQFLIEAHPDATARILDRLCGLLDDQGRPDGSDLLDHQRRAIQDELGFTYAQFDAAWAAWIETPAAEAAQVPLALRTAVDED